MVAYPAAESFSLPVAFTFTPFPHTLIFSLSLPLSLFHSLFLFLCYTSLKTHGAQYKIILPYRRGVGACVCARVSRRGVWGLARYKEPIAGGLGHGGRAGGQCVGRRRGGRCGDDLPATLDQANDPRFLTTRTRAFFCYSFFYLFFDGRLRCGGGGVRTRGTCVFVLVFFYSSPLC